MSATSTVHDPAAAADAQVAIGRARFTILTPRLIRLEWAEDGRFEDRATLSVCNRRLPVPAFTVTRHGEGCRIATGRLVLTYAGGAFTGRSLRIAVADGTAWRPGQTDKRNLGGTRRTLDGFDGGCKEEWVPGRRKTDPWHRTGKLLPQPMPPGLLSRSGWAVHDDSAAAVLDQTGWASVREPGLRQDFYFFGYGLDFQACLREATWIFGRQPLPPRFVLGYWYSRYWCHTDRELLELARDFDRRGIAVDVLVVDMDWHKLGWTGYSFDPDCFPDPAGFLADLKARDLKIALNLHPAGGVGGHEDSYAAFCAALPDARRRREPWPKKSGGLQVARHRIPFDCTDREYMRAYFHVLHRPLQKMGVDFWWMDWQQGSQTALTGLDPLPWLNTLHWRDQTVDPARKRLRPLIFSRFGGLGSGRHPIGFSGDTHATWRTLAYQPGFTATAGNVLFGYWSHDIGGHMDGKPLDGELYLRWMQYGALSPVLRTHATKRPWCDRRFWTFAEPWSRLLEDAVRRRYQMAPELYTACRAAWDTGLSPCRPLYLHHPKVAEAYRHEDQYHFGVRYLCAPVVTPADPDTLLSRRPLWLPAGRWHDTARGLILHAGRHAPAYTVAEVPLFVPAGAITVEQSTVPRLRPGSYPHPVLVAHPGGDGTGEWYEDDGLTEGYRRDECVRIALSQTVPSGRSGATVLRIHPARGAFPGFLRRRPLSVLFPDRLPPTGAVTVDGREIPWSREGVAGTWSWDAERVALRIHLKQVDLVRGATVRVTGLTAAPAGLAGVIRRLHQIMEWTKANSPVNALHAEERLPIRLAQTGHRIALDPATAPVEIRALRRGLRRLPAVIRFHVRAWDVPVKANDPEWVKVKLDLAKAWARAGRLLAALRRDFPECC